MKPNSLKPPQVFNHLTAVFLFSILSVNLQTSKARASNSCHQLFEESLFPHAAKIQKTKSGISERELETATRTAILKTPEFKFIQETAKKMGVQVWMFGGTASSYLHYVKWDLMRQKKILNLQPDRFDYGFTNIFRSTQDLDIVIDGNLEQIKRFQKLLEAQFPYFKGSANAWEVRGLRVSQGSSTGGFYKEALLNDPNFSNQNTDTNSLAMVEISQSKDPQIRDLRNWTTGKNQFLEDTLNNQITYLRNPKHFTTARAERGENPEILSAIRLLVKAFQFNLTISPESLNDIKQVIQNFNPSEIENTWANYQINANAIKLVMHSSNIEYAFDTLDKLGLREKLAKVKGNSNEIQNASYWLNKEPLRSFEKNEAPKYRSGQLKDYDFNSSGKSAKELGITIVAHETNNMLAFESITRSHTGEPNVLISRVNFPNEFAARGDGFYTAIGRFGAKGTGLTIRFNVDPNAIEGTDFIQRDDYLVFLNKKSLQIIHESIKIDFENLADIIKSNAIGDMKSETALIEMFKRKLSTTYFHQQLDQIYQIKDPHIFVKKVTALLDIVKYFDISLEKNQIDYFLKKYVALVEMSEIPDFKKINFGIGLLNLKLPANQSKLIKDKIITHLKNINRSKSTSFSEDIDAVLNIFKYSDSFDEIFYSELQSAIKFMFIDKFTVEYANSSNHFTNMNNIAENILNTTKNNSEIYKVFSSAFEKSIINKIKMLSSKKSFSFDDFINYVFEIQNIYATNLTKFSSERQTLFPILEKVLIQKFAEIASDKTKKLSDILDYAKKINDDFALFQIKNSTVFQATVSKVLVNRFIDEPNKSNDPAELKQNYVKLYHLLNILPEKQKKEIQNTIHSLTSKKMNVTSVLNFKNLNDAVQFSNQFIKDNAFRHYKSDLEFKKVMIDFLKKIEAFKIDDRNFSDFLLMIESFKTADFDVEVQNQLINILKKSMTGLSEVNKSQLATLVVLDSKLNIYIDQLMNMVNRQIFNPILKNSLLSHERQFSKLHTQYMLMAAARKNQILLFSILLDSGIFDLGRKIDFQTTLENELINLKNPDVNRIIQAKNNQNINAGTISLGDFYNLIQNKNISSIKNAILLLGPKINEIYSNKYLIEWAIESDSTDIVKAISEAPGFLYPEDKSRRPSIALAENKPSMFKFLIETLNVNPNVYIYNEWLLHVVAKSPRTLQQLETLLKLPNIDLNVTKSRSIVYDRGRSKETPMGIAILSGNVDAVKAFLSVKKFDINHTADYFGSYLLKAIEANNIEIVKLLLAHPKIQINQKTNSLMDYSYGRGDSLTPYEWAIKFGHKKIAALIKSHKSFKK
jgi:hypothetical protein